MPMITIHHASVELSARVDSEIAALEQAESWETHYFPGYWQGNRVRLGEQADGTWVVSGYRWFGGGDYCEWREGGAFERVGFESDGKVVPLDDPRSQRVLANRKREKELRSSFIDRTKG